MLFPNWGLGMRTKKLQIKYHWCMFDKPSKLLATQQNFPKLKKVQVSAPEA